ncbi:MAG: hypothetical protein HKN20_07285 [Gemmatimonadetes bacterium]|nr:hypothetical protein [Gemmatimonadota bacterium]
MAKSRGILLAVGLIAAAGIGYLALEGPAGPKEGLEGTIGATTERHQTDKTEYNAKQNELAEAERIVVLGQIAARFDFAPEEAEEMLADHGWSKYDYEKMLRNIRADEKKLEEFEVARRDELTQALAVAKGETSGD